MIPRVVYFVFAVAVSATVSGTPPPQSEAAIYLADAWNDTWKEDADKAVFVEVTVRNVTVDEVAVVDSELPVYVKARLATKAKHPASILIIVSGDVPYRRVAILAQSLRKVGASDICVCQK